MSNELIKLALDLATMHHTDEGYDDLRSKVRVAAKEALAKQEQGEPAFYGFVDKNNCCVHICYTPWAAGGPNNELSTAYYTTPQQRTWVGLTDEEHTEIQKQTPYTEFMSPSGFAALCQAAVEVKLKEKNT